MRKKSEAMAEDPSTTLHFAQGDKHCSNCSNLRRVDNAANWLKCYSLSKFVGEVEEQNWCNWRQR